MYLWFVEQVEIMGFTNLGEQKKIDTNDWLSIDKIFDLVPIIQTRWNSNGYRGIASGW
jgi:hypothetical protein